MMRKISQGMSTVIATVDKLKVDILAILVVSKRHGQEGKKRMRKLRMIDVMLSALQLVDFPDSTLLSPNACLTKMRGGSLTIDPGNEGTERTHRLPEWPLLGYCCSLFVVMLSQIRQRDLLLVSDGLSIVTHFVTQLRLFTVGWRGSLLW
jgi:hypothetical protein